MENALQKPNTSHMNADSGTGFALCKVYISQVLYICREKYCLMFDEPIPIKENVWYVVWARIQGPSSDCGSSGQATVVAEDQ
jgi:hypothetical protein